MTKKSCSDSKPCKNLPALKNWSHCSYCSQSKCTGPVAALHWCQCHNSDLIVLVPLSWCGSMLWKFICCSNLATNYLFHGLRYCHCLSNHTGATATALELVPLPQCWVRSLWHHCRKASQCCKKFICCSNLPTTYLMHGLCHHCCCHHLSKCTGVIAA